MQATFWCEDKTSHYVRWSTPTYIMGEFDFHVSTTQHSLALWASESVKKGCCNTNWKCEHWKYYPACTASWTL